MKEITKIDIAIVGGGIVGLMSALQLSQKHPNYSIALFEQELYLGEHTSSRNSGVLHAGIYYQENSLKHTLCIEGNRMWRSLCEKYQIDILPCGKHIIATNRDEAERLDTLFKQAQKNEVPRIRRSKKDEIESLQQSTNVSQAIFSPSTAVIDISTAINLITKEITNSGAHILTRTKVTDLTFENNSYTFKAGNDWINSTILINCAGLFSIELRKMLGLSELENHYVKGSYLSCTAKTAINYLIYPVPPIILGQKFKSLGVHCVLDIDGKIRFGPNTEDVHQLDYKTSSNIVEEMWPAINSLFKNIRKDDLHADFCGIRPKITDSTNGELISDFWIKNGANYQLPGYIELCGIESPGLTASPAIAKFISKLL